MPTLLYDRPESAQFALSVGAPLAFGLITGIVLGISEPVYILLSVLGIGGGFFAGLEHDNVLEGVYRGLMGGLLFGTGILLANGIIGETPKTKLPDPAILLTTITMVFGAGLGALGARHRVRRSASG